MAMATDEKIVLGSGKLYLAVYDKTTGIPADNIIEDDGNLLGWIQGGATLTYKPTFHEATDDLGQASKTALTKEDVTLKSGVMTWNGNTLAKLCSTARVTTDDTLHTRTVKIGGIKNADGKNYVIRFLHEDAVDGDIRVTIVGKNQSDFSLAFATGKETVIDAEFTAIPCDSDGTLIIFKESAAA